MATETAVEKLKKLEAEAKELRATAKKEALANAKSAIAELNSLGFNYQLVEASVGGGGVPSRFKAKAKGKKAITRKRDPNKPCPVCGELGHDGRFHRKANLAKAAKKKAS